MKSMVVLLLTLLSPFVVGANFEIISECDKPIWYAFANENNGGADGLNNSGSWDVKWSKGWFRIGPFQKATVTGKRFLRIEGEGSTKPITRNWPKAGDNSESIETFCVNPGDKFEYEQYVYDHRNPKPLRPIVERCLKAGGRWKVFEGIKDNVTTYTVFQNSCNSTNTARMAGITYKRDPQLSQTTLIKESPNSASWWATLPNGDASFINFKKIENGFVVLNPGNDVLYYLKEGDFRVKYAGANTVTKVGGGTWIDP